MDIWLTDLDNTLIYSHKHNIPLPKTTAEYYQGREQSYITDRTLRFCQQFCESKNHLFVPLTTRIPPQFERISPLWEQLSYRYALVSNGAVLLIDGVSDPVWEQRSLAMAEQYTDLLLDAFEVLKQYVEPAHLHEVLPYMVYAKTPQDPALMALLRERYAPHGISVIYTGTKLYCVPGVFSKGAAVRRFRERLAASGDRIIASGDSPFDVSMLMESDIAIYPQELSVPEDLRHQHIPVEGFFADGLCRALSALLFAGE